MRAIVIISTLAAGMTLIAVPQGHTTIRLIAGLCCLVGVIVIVHTWTAPVCRDGKLGLRPPLPEMNSGTTGQMQL